MKKLMLAALGAAILFLSLPAAADTPEQLLQQARAAMDKKDYDTAKRLYQESAEQGNAQAADELGEWYFNLAAVGGFANKVDGKEQNDDKVNSYLDQAEIWLTKAAEQGNTPAQASLAYMYEDDYYGKEDKDKSRRWQLAAAQGGDAENQYKMGYDLEKGDGMPQDVGAAIDWYKKSAAQDYNPAQDALLRLTPPGDDPVKQALHDGLVADNNSDTDGAIKAYRRAAALGSTEGQWRLGTDIMGVLALNILYAGLNDKPYTPPAASCKEMLDNLQKAVAKNYSPAVYDMSNVYGNGYCVKEDDAKAKEWLRKAAKLGNKDALKALQSKN
ncbi:MAG: hypothetical protein ACM3ZT_06380 [Bacillota bacterium]